MDRGVVVLFFLRIFFIIGMCDGHQLGTKISNCSALPRLHHDEQFAAFEYCAFPTAKLNFECVKASCAALSSSTLCPFDSQGKTNEDKLESAEALIKECLKKSTSICNATSTLYHIPDKTPATSSVGVGRANKYMKFLFEEGHMAMPWLSNSFAISFDGDSRDELNIEMGTTLKYKTLITGRLDFPLRIPESRLKDVEERHINFRDLEVNFKIVRPETNIELTIPSDPSKKPTLKNPSQTNNQYKFQAERLHKTDWTKEENSKANAAFNEVMEYMMDFTESNYFMERFIGTYAAYALMAINQACPSPDLLSKITQLV